MARDSDPEMTKTSSIRFRSERRPICDAKVRSTLGFVSRFEQIPQGVLAR